MARRRYPEEHPNHEAWAIPYADLMTLLLAFFVVMYAISSINESKYRVVADALSSAFGAAPRTLEPVQVGSNQLKGGQWDAPSVIHAGSRVGRSAATAINDPTLLPAMASQMRSPMSFRDQAQLQQAERQLDDIAQRLTAALSPLIERGMISVRRTELWIEVEINSDILFGAGSATLEKGARSTLDALASVLRDAPNGVRVEGYTDNKPIATHQFPSNWELSAARAASVVHLFADQGLQPSRLSMIGYGEFRPRADNGTEAGRNANRRVLLVILADGGAGSAEEAAPQGALTAAAPIPPPPAAAVAGGSGSAPAVPATIEGVN